MNKTRPNKQANGKKVKPNPIFFIHLVKTTLYFFRIKGSQAKEK